MIIVGEGLAPPAKSSLLPPRDPKGNAFRPAGFGYAQDDRGDSFIDTLKALQKQCLLFFCFTNQAVNNTADRLRFQGYHNKCSELRLLFRYRQK